MTDAAPVLGNEAQRAEFFARVRRRLSLDVPAALRDLTAPAVRGDLDLDPESWTKAGVIAAKPAAVLIPGARPRRRSAWHRHWSSRSGISTSI